MCAVQSCTLLCFSQAGAFPKTCPAAGFSVCRLGVYMLKSMVIICKSVLCINQPARVKEVVSDSLFRCCKSKC
uniref:Putative secreted protein n=1 Tax=Ixodes scapularis TaxID=6945 RepID=A0A4D5RC35_IXOSC